MSAILSDGASRSRGKKSGSASRTRILGSGEGGREEKMGRLDAVRRGGS